MTELERRALMGDKQAQEECTRQGILLPCPKCYGTKIRFETNVDTPMWTSGFVCSCGFRQGSDYIDLEIALPDWNTRPAPPVGRCGECEHWYKGHCSTGPCATEETDADFYCSNFQAIKQATSDKNER